MDDNETKVSLVNTRGRVVWVRKREADELIKNGYKMILNPKEQYYPQYDSSAANIPDVKEEKDKDVLKVVQL